MKLAILRGHGLKCWTFAVQRVCRGFVWSVNFWELSHEIGTHCPTCIPVLFCTDINMYIYIHHAYTLSGLNKIQMWGPNPVMISLLPFFLPPQVDNYKSIILAPKAKKIMLLLFFIFCKWKNAVNYGVITTSTVTSPISNIYIYICFSA